jgi:serine/threonine protein kinase
MNDNYKSFSWRKKLGILINIAYGLKEIHEKQMIHRDFHIGNILFDTYFMKEYDNKTYISDMGLCGEVGSVDKTKIYGIMPYVAPEVLRSKPYTQAADIYSFGMIMYFVATGRQPFDNCAHDYKLAIDLYKGVKPELNEPEAPKSYINLMKKCLDLNPTNRPNVTVLCQLLCSIILNNSEIKEAENYRILHLTSSIQTDTHPKLFIHLGYLILIQKIFQMMMMMIVNVWTVQFKIKIHYIVFTILSLFFKHLQLNDV